VKVILDHSDHGMLDDLLFGGELGRHLLLELLGQPAKEGGRYTAFSIYSTSNALSKANYLSFGFRHPS
jgi:hypothetical protein